MKKQVRIFLNKPLLVGGCIYCGLCIVLCTLMVFFLEKEFIKTTSQSDKIVSMIIFSALGILVIISSVLCWPKWGSSIVCTSKGIKVKSQTIISYDRYRYMYDAYYTHRGILPIGYKVHFIVLSQVKLKDFELNHINQIKSSQQILIFRKNHKLISFLLSVLPENQKLKLQKLVKDF